MKPNAMRRVVWLLVLLVCAAGAGLSFELSQHHIRGGFGPDSLFARMCEEGTASCDEVVRSPWGTFGGIPTAVWGLMYFTGVGLWYLLAGLPNRAGRGWQLLPIGGTLAGLAVAAWLDYVMFARLPSWCPLCFGTHIASLLIFVGSLLLWPRKRAAPAGEEPSAGSEPAERAVSPGVGRVMATCAAILIAALAVHQNFMNRHHRAEEKKAKEMLKEWASSLPRQGQGPIAAALAVQPDDAVWGDPRAPDTVVVFSDFECPVCGGFAAFWRKEVEPYAAGRVRLVFHYFPMNTGCNPAVNRTLHERSCEAAAIAEAARLQGGNDAFWKMHDELFINQLRGKKRLSPEELARKVGLDPVRLEKDRNSPPVRDRIARDIERARQVGVKGTPAVFLNGRLVQTSAGDPVWQSFLESLHAGSPATSPAQAGDCGELRAALAECQARLREHVESGTSVTEVERSRPRTLALRSDDPSKGNPKARAVVVVFADFESPRCREFATYWRDRVEPHVLNRTRLVFRHFPMNTDCNPVVSRTAYADSCRSAAAAEAARLQGGNEAFWRMYDELFENQVRRPMLSYAELARRIGLDAARLERDMNSAAVRDRIQQDISFAQQAEVSDVPTVFLNGRIIGAWGRDELWQYFLRFPPDPKPATASAPAR